MLALHSSIGELSSTVGDPSGLNLHLHPGHFQLHPALLERQGKSLLFVFSSLLGRQALACHLLDGTGALGVGLDLVKQQTVAGVVALED